MIKSRCTLYILNLHNVKQYLKAGKQVRLKVLKAPMEKTRQSKKNKREIKQSS